MQYFGQISKMQTALSNPVKYTLPIGEKKVSINNIIGSNIQIHFDGEIKCVACSKKINKTYMQGYCYPCFISLPQTEECVFKPHLCRAHEGKARDMSWAESHCLTNTYVYLSLTSNLKVGVTRENHIPSRWIDQGAHYAIKFAKTPNRHLAGMIEVALSKHMSDRTKWRQMIQGKYDMIDLMDKKNQLVGLVPDDYKKYILEDSNIVKFEYPMTTIPEKIKSFNFDKNHTLSGKLTGIKGQYIIVNNEIVVNIRKYTGYHFLISHE